MSFSVATFTQGLAYDGARPNLFEVYLTFPASVVSGGTNASQELTLMAKSASIPSSRMGVITVPYMGRQIKLAGNVVYDDWTITIINDEDFPVRNAFESWHNLINSHAGNLRDPSMLQLAGYTVNASVLQYGKAGPATGPIKQYDFVGMFPNMVGPIQLAWDNNDAIEQFDVTFSMLYWTATVPVVITT